VIAACESTLRANGSRRCQRLYGADIELADRIVERFDPQAAERSQRATFYGRQSNSD